MKNPMLTAALAGAVLLVPTIAAAHVALAQPSAPAGAYYVGAFRVGHGCDGSPTTSIRIEIPPGVTIARPQPKPGWTLSITRQKPAKPIVPASATASERVSAITWSGRLPADQFDEFAVMMRLPASAGPLAFPVVQTCEKGQRRWTDAPRAGAPPANPAPVLQIASPPAAPAHHH